MLTRKEIDQVFKQYLRSTNMSYAELEAWSKTACSRKASLDRGPIQRNLHLLSIPKSDWGEKEVVWAKKTIAFNARMKKVKAGQPVKGCGKSKRTISLMNWAYNPNKQRR